MVTDIQQATIADMQEKIAETHELRRLERNERDEERRLLYAKRIGQNLYDFQAALPQGKFITLVQAEFGMSFDVTQTYLTGNDTYLEHIANETRSLLKRTSQDIIQIGKNLLEAKARLPHGEFIPWVKAEIGISQKTAWRFMQIAQGKSVTMTDLPVIEPVERKEDPDKVRIRTRETDEEKSKRVRDFFADFPHLQVLSNREIAKRCEVTEGLVRKIKKELCDEGGSTVNTPVETDRIDYDVDPLEVIAEPQKLPRIEPSEDVLLKREIRRQEVQERNEQLKERGADLPTGKYSCLVVDPPWVMQKIEREERPNQFEFDYPTMTEDELKRFPLPDFAADDCHLYLWTTQKHLPLALRLAEHWGFTYQCLMTWIKNVGFTPFSWMYSTEHVLFCTKGSLPLLEIGRRLDFGGKVRDHSRKPDEFYDIVREVSPGPRLDVFSREKRDGFEQYGNEVAKYV